jgi:hypothetical protein
MKVALGRVILVSLFRLVGLRKEIWQNPKHNLTQDTADNRKSVITSGLSFGAPDIVTTGHEDARLPL